jgi:biotin carboxylase
VTWAAALRQQRGSATVGLGRRLRLYESCCPLLKETVAVFPGELETTDVVDLRAGNDLVLEEYLAGVEFDVDLVLEEGECVFSSVSRNWPTAEPSFQETGLHCPPDHRSKPVGQLVELVVRTVQALGFAQGVLDVEGKCTTKGPRIIEVNARLGGGRIHQIVEAVWGVDLIEAYVRSALGLAQKLTPSRKPQCAVVNAFVYAPATGRLTALHAVLIDSLVTESA